MAAKKSKPPAESLALKLTKKQRESLIHATRLRGGLKERLRAAPDGSRSIQFTRKELEDISQELYEALRFAPSADKRRLDAVLEKVEDILDDQDQRALRKRREAADTTGLVHQLKVTLKGIKPPIWRRIQVLDGTLGELHAVLQVAMGWQDYHMHQFVARGENYGQHFPDDFDLEIHDEEDALLSKIAGKGRKGSFVYEYDFGDGWEHEIVLEKTLPPEPGVEYPRCLDGARACPPEDCGGIWGYAQLLATLSDPSRGDHEEMMEWVGGAFDPEDFSIEAVNKELRDDS